MKKEKISVVYNDYDTSEAEELAKTYKKNVKVLYPLRIDSNTIIYVPKRKQTEEYAEDYRRRLQRARRTI